MGCKGCGGGGSCRAARGEARLRHGGSKWKESEGTQVKLVPAAGNWLYDMAEDTGTQTSEDSQFSGISASVDSHGYVGKDRGVQYQAKYEEDVEGGGYVKPGTMMEGAAEEPDSPTMTNNIHDNEIDVDGLEKFEDIQTTHGGEHESKGRESFDLDNEDDKAKHVANQAAKQHVHMPEYTSMGTGAPGGPLPGPVVPLGLAAVVAAYKSGSRHCILEYLDSLTREGYAGDEVTEVAELLHRECTS